MKRQCNVIVIKDREAVELCESVDRYSCRRLPPASKRGEIKM